MSLPVALFFFDRNLGDAVLFIGAFMLLQMALTFGATAWIWMILIRRKPLKGATRRDSLIFYAAIAYTTAALASVLIWFGSTSQHIDSGVIAKFGILASIVAFAFAISGRGRGRAVSAVSAVLMAGLLRLYLP
jgi:hypothetical protein